MATRRNKGGSGSAAQPRPIKPGEARDLLRQGCILIDTRSPGRYGEGHVEGAINVYFSGYHFGERVAKVTPPDARLIVVAQNPSDVQRAAKALVRAGRPHVVGYLTGDPHTWLQAGLPVTCTAQIPVQALEEKGELQVLDVREPEEWMASHIPGAINIPFYELDRRVDELDRARPVVVYCSSGQLSSTATSILERHGFQNVANVQGGLSAWREAHYELARTERAVPGATRVEDLGYGLKVEVDLPFEEALAKAVEAIRAEGMQIVTQTDLQQLLEQKLGLSFRKYCILGAYDARLAYDAVQAVPDVGLFMPCSVVVYEEDRRAVVTAINPDAVVGMVRHPALTDCAGVMRARLEMVLQRVRQAASRKAA